MKSRSLITLLTVLLTYTVFGQNPDSVKTSTPRLKLFSETDLGLLIFTGGFTHYFGLRKGPHSIELGRQHFNAPTAFFSGKPTGFDLRVDYILSLHYSYFWNGKTDAGFFTRVMYHNKKQTVIEKESRISKPLYSDLVGVELGYVYFFSKGFYVTPRIGALYYLKSPQGGTNQPVKIGERFYDNDRHKIWDTYFIPTVSFGYSLPVD